jgi:hypothetical protein
VEAAHGVGRHVGQGDVHQHVEHVERPAPAGIDVEVVGIASPSSL